MLLIYKKLMTALVFVSVTFAFTAYAEGGVSLQQTRIVYLSEKKFESLSVINSSNTRAFLVQSWVEDANGKKSKDFIVTPPLYLSSPGNENTLRLMRLAKNTPQDRETLYYFIAKAIPSVENDQKNVLHISTASRLKLFVRPPGLVSDVDKAPDSLTFHRVGQQLEIINPTPYYITMTKIFSGNKAIKDIMVAPKSHTFETLPAGATNSVTYQTINDYGAVTKPQSKKIS